MSLAEADLEAKTVDVVTLRSLAGACKVYTPTWPGWLGALRARGGGAAGGRSGAGGGGAGDVQTGAQRWHSAVTGLRTHHAVVTQWHTRTAAAAVRTTFYLKAVSAPQRHSEEEHVSADGYEQHSREGEGEGPQGKYHVLVSTSSFIYSPNLYAVRGRSSLQEPRPSPWKCLKGWLIFEIFPKMNASWEVNTFFGVSK